METIPTGATMPTRQAVNILLKENLHVEETAVGLLSLGVFGYGKAPPKIRFGRLINSQGCVLGAPGVRRFAG
ncbi:MAG TPA: hypothetical protein VHJ78_03460 [Actinomycetota bacterium]|nr:hypothetical protein [Actinomycetota bacterium]